jgi:hypothetical protein
LDEAHLVADTGVEVYDEAGLLASMDIERRTNMGKVSTGLSMSLDGFIAGPNDSPGSPLGEGGERLFAWYSSGDTEYRLPGTEMVFMVSPQSRRNARNTGAGRWEWLGGGDGETWTRVEQAVRSSLYQPERRQNEQG